MRGPLLSAAKVLDMLPFSFVTAKSGSVLTWGRGGGESLWKRFIGVLSGEK